MDGSDSSHMRYESTAIQKSTMAAFHRVFEFWEPYKVIICKDCRFSVLPSAVQKHINTAHSYLSIDTRRTIIEAAYEMEHSGKLASIPSEIVYPPQGAEGHRLLETFDDGNRCIFPTSNGPCGHITRSVRNMQEHLRREHEWTNERPRGRNHRAAAAGGKDDVWVGGIRCQQMGRRGGLTRFFQVARASEVGEAAADRSSTARAAKEIAADLLAISKAQDEKDKEDMQLVRAEANQTSDGWVTRTKWVGHFKGIDQAWIIETTWPPDPSSDEAREQQLIYILLAMERVIWRAQRESHPSVASDNVLFAIERRETGTETNEKPFYAEQQQHTIRKYAKQICMMVSYIWRTCQFEAVHQEDQDEAVERGEAMREVRPPYRFIREQQHAIEVVEAAVADVVARESQDSSTSGSDESRTSNGSRPERPDTRRLERAVLDWYITLLDHKTKDHEYDSAVYSALAATGCMPGGGWADVGIFTPKLSATVTTAKMMVLYKARVERNDEIDEICAADDVDIHEARERAESHYDRVVRMVNRFMVLAQLTGGGGTPIDSILKLRAYGRMKHTQTNAPGVIDWHGDTLLYGKTQFSIGMLRSMVHGLLHDTTIQLRRDLLMMDVDNDGQMVAGKALPLIDWKRLVDNAAESSALFNFAKDARNSQALGSGVDGMEWLMTRMTDNRPLLQRFTQGSAGDGVGRSWDVKAIADYGFMVRKFQRSLMVLTHITGGQPARATEIVTVRHTNEGGRGQARGVFVEDGLVVTMTRYHKGLASTGKEKIVHRYLPQEVGELMVYYIWLVLPFWRALVAAGSRGKAPRQSTYLWQPAERKKWSYPTIVKPANKKRKRGYKRSKSAHKGTIGHERKRSLLSSAPGSDDEFEEWDGERWWEMDQWGTVRVTHALNEASLKYMGVKIGIMAWRHATKAIFRRYMGSNSVETRFLEDADEFLEAAEVVLSADTAEALDIASAKQTNHGVPMGDGVYGRSIHESPFSRPGDRGLFRKVSQAWHKFLMFPSSVRDGPLDDMMQQSKTVARVRWRRLGRTDVKAELCNMIGADTEFRSIQEAAMGAVMRQESPVVVVMGTGAGKSLLFQLPARCSEGVTIVISPLVALQADMVQRGERYGISSVVWEASRPEPKAQLVFVTPESAASITFWNFINRQRAMGTLDRIVIDECHVILDTGRDGGWRPTMLQLRQLIQAEVPMVYLTATLRPADEDEFRELFGLEKDDIHTFRGITTRINVAYSVHRYVIEDISEEDTLKALVREKMAAVGERGQIIVYCDTVKKVEKYAEMLGGIGFHAKVGDIAAKKLIIRQLAEGTGQVFTATNALGLGVDAPRVRVVIHAGLVRRLRDYAQESGRAGRDTLASEAIIMYKVHKVTARKSHRSIDMDAGDVGRGFTDDEAAKLGIEKEMVEFLETKGCVRRVLDREMDGRRDRAGCEDGEEKCYRCRADQRRVAIEREISSGEGLAYRRRGSTEAGEADQEEDVKMEEIEDQVMQRQEQQRRVMGQRERDHHASEAKQAQEFEQLIQTWSRGCTWCRAVGKSEAEVRSHVLHRCKDDDAEQVRVEVQEVQGALEVTQRPLYSGCFTCGLPQSICRRWQFDERGRGEGGGYEEREGGRCQYRYTLVDGLVSLMNSDEEDVVVNRWREEMAEAGIHWGYDDQSMAVLTVWMVKRQRWLGMESNRMCKEFWVISGKLGRR